MSNAVAADRLRSFIERVERLKDEIKALQDDVKQVKAEAKGEGFSVGTINEIIKLRAMDAAERQEREALLDLYKAALGMLDGTPLGAAAVNRLMNPPKPPPADDRDQDDQATDDPEPEEEDADVAGDAAPETAAPPAAAPAAPTAEDIEDARRAGGDAGRGGARVLDNPWPAGDPRRAAWDEGWCQAMGSDGMDLPPALRPTRKPKKPPPGSGAADAADADGNDDGSGDDAAAGAGGADADNGGAR